MAKLEKKTKALIDKLTKHNYDPLGCTYITLNSCLQNILLPEIIDCIMEYIPYYIESTLEGKEYYSTAASSPHFMDYGTEIAFVIKPPNIEYNKYKLYTYKILSIKLKLKHTERKWWDEALAVECFCGIESFKNNIKYNKRPGDRTTKSLWKSDLFKTDTFIEFKNINLKLKCNKDSYYIFYLYLKTKEDHYNIPLIDVEATNKTNDKMIKNLNFTHSVCYYERNGYKDRSDDFIIPYEIIFMLDFKK